MASHAIFEPVRQSPHRHPTKIPLRICPQAQEAREPSEESRDRLETKIAPSYSLIQVAEKALGRRGSFRLRRPLRESSALCKGRRETNAPCTSHHLLLTSPSEYSATLTSPNPGRATEYVDKNLGAVQLTQGARSLQNESLMVLGPDRECEMAGKALLSSPDFAHMLSGSRTCESAQEPTHRQNQSSRPGSTTHFPTTTLNRSWHTSTSERASDAGLCPRPTSLRPKGCRRRGFGAVGRVAAAPRLTSTRPLRYQPSKMKDDPEDVRKQLEAIAGREIHVEAAQLKFLWYPAGAYDYSDGYVALQNVFLPGLRCNAARLLDASGASKLIEMESGSSG